MSTVTKKQLLNIVREEVYTHLKAVLKEAQTPKEFETKESHEISAAASTLKKAIDAFNDENLPEVPSELSTALTTATGVLTNMSDNPGRYKGGIKADEDDVEQVDGHLITRPKDIKKI